MGEDSLSLRDSLLSQQEKKPAQNACVSGKSAYDGNDLGTLTVTVPVGGGTLQWSGDIDGDFECSVDPNWGFAVMNQAELNAYLAT